VHMMAFGRGNGYTQVGDDTAGSGALSVAKLYNSYVTYLLTILSKRSGNASLCNHQRSNAPISFLNKPYLHHSFSFANFPFAHIQMQAIITSSSCPSQQAPAAQTHHHR